MAEEEKKEGAEEAAAPKAPKGPLILVLLNTLAVAGALGTLVYTQILFKRPPITEQAEREKIKEKTPVDEGPKEKGVVKFDSATLNILPTPTSPGSTRGKAHYATMAFAIEINDTGALEKIDAFRPVFMDHLLTLMGNKTYEQLTSVQGRYLLRTEIVDLMNQVLKKEIATNVYFTEFIIQ